MIPSFFFLMAKDKHVKTLLQAFKEAGKVSNQDSINDITQKRSFEAAFKETRDNAVVEILSTDEKYKQQYKKASKIVNAHSEHSHNHYGKGILLTNSNFEQESDQNLKIDKGLTVGSETTSKTDIDFLEEAQIILGEEQLKILDLIVEKEKCVFFTGAAGTGKSMLLVEIIRRLKIKYKHQEDAVAVTATTGLAGLKIGGKTYHSYFGIGLGDADEKQLIQSISRRKDVVKLWETCRVLIIDEISLLHSKMLEKLHNIAQYFKKSTLPFGGIQLVFVGDFFQLPPVVASYSNMLETKIVTNYEEYNQFKKEVYAFKSHIWNKCLHFQLELTKVYRQIADPEFVNYLNEVRLGEVSDEADAAFNSLSRKIHKFEGIEPTQLYPTKKEANFFNHRMSNELPSKPIVFKCEKRGKMFGLPAFNSISDSFLAPDQISLKVGSQVMLIKNYTQDLVNGSLGVVIDFIDKENLNLLSHNGYCKGGVFGFLEKDNNFKQLSVLDREVSGTESNADTFEKSLFAVEYLYDTTENFVLPVVRFISQNNDTPLLKIVIPNEFNYLDQKTEEVLVSKKQIPLILAWALSVHKSQGQTYQLLKVDVSKAFEVGQVYVALSRATSRKGLQILGWNKKRVLTNGLVKEFYKSITPVNKIDTDSIIANLQLEIKSNDVSSISSVEYDLNDFEEPSLQANIIDITNDECISLENLSDILGDDS
ncbi:hypothetical protein QEN19_004427 [Hanseniaspora menglaensis]